MIPPAIQQDVQTLSADDPKRLSEQDFAKSLVTIVNHLELQDQFIRERNVKKWRKQMCYWDNVQYLWWSEFAKDWRTPDQARDENFEADIDPALYAKVINIYRAHGEVIIAAMSAALPTVPFFPDDADVPEDVSTAKAFTKIGALIQKHNYAELLFMKALYILYNQGVVFGYNEYRKDPKFGFRKEENTQPHAVTNREYYCPNCGFGHGSEEVSSTPIQPQSDVENPAENSAEPQEEPTDAINPTEMPGGQQLGSVGPDAGGAENVLPANNSEPPPVGCPQCQQTMTPEYEDYTEIVPRLVGYNDIPKGRECLEVYGPLNVKVSGWATKEDDMPYLILETDEHYARLQSIFEDQAEYIGPGGDTGQFDRWARRPNDVNYDLPRDLVNTKRCWLKPWTYNILGVKDHSQEIAKLEELFPDGVYVCILNGDMVVDAVPDQLDDHWTFTKHPLAETIHAASIGESVMPIQDMTNEAYNLTLESIEFGIPETFADDDVVNFDAYDKSEARPGQMTPVKAPVGQPLSSAFHEVKTSSISQEIDRFMNRLERSGQFVSGALPTVFGGAIQGGTGTAKEYEMSRSQALQRLQICWKIVKIWWAQMLAKAVRSFVNNMEGDEKYVEKRGASFVNVWILKSELGGKVGEVEPDVNESFPIGWAQKRDMILQMLQMQNEDIMTVLRHPENASLIALLIGMPELYIPGDDDRNKQLIEISQMIQEEPQQMPGPMVPGPDGQPMPAPGPDGQPMQPQEMSSVPIEPKLDNNAVEAETCKAWLKSEVGLYYKKTKPAAYMNVLLHMEEHLNAAQQEQMQQMMMQGAGNEQTSNSKPQNGQR